MGVIVRRSGVLRRAGVHRLATLLLALSLAALPVLPASAEPEWNGGYRERWTSPAEPGPPKPTTRSPM
jgi:hypothetical protein